MNSWTVILIPIGPCRLSCVSRFIEVFYVDDLRLLIGHVPSVRSSCVVGPCPCNKFSPGSKVLDHILKRLDTFVIVHRVKQCASIGPKACDRWYAEF